MNCDFDYCIHNEKFFCQLEETSINTACQCEECVIVPLPEGSLEIYKQDYLRKIAEQQKEHKA